VPSDLLVAENITKRFGQTVALDDVSVSFRAGEVHALMGENGAGKSTLGKVIAGLHRPDAGRVRIAGRVLRPGSIDDAFDAGVRIVHQELAQCPALSVAENLCLHALPRRRGLLAPLGLVDRRAMAGRAARLLLNLEPSIDVRRPLGSLSPGHRQVVQIAGALDDRATTAGSRGARAIVLDEPTSSLSVAEADRLFAIVRRLAADGITVVYVSHRMREIFEVCDRVTVLRDGRWIATSDVSSIDESTLVEQMIGRRLVPHGSRASAGAAPPDGAGEVSALRAIAAPADDPSARQAAAEAAALVGVRLEVRRLSSPGRLRDVSLTVEPGEVVGLGGLVGAGRSELLDAIFGLDPRATGEVLVGDSPVPRAHPRAAIRAGIGYVPEDRALQGLFFQLGADENIVLPRMDRLARFAGLRNRRTERADTSERMAALRVKAASPAARPGELSGGNQQKLLLARWMGRDARVLLLDEPTRGIDVATKAEIHRAVRDAARNGAAVLLVSSEMPELLALSDRVLVLCNGRLTGELRGPDLTQANILRLAAVDAAPQRATG
jgi:ABC-type sugar transport system ATPase subunit